MVAALQVSMYYRQDLVIYCKGRTLMKPFIFSVFVMGILISSNAFCQENHNATLLGSFAEGPATSVVVSGSMAYMGIGGRLQAVDISDPANPIKLGFLDMPGRIRGLDIRGTAVFVAADYGGMLVIDVSNPNALLELGTVDISQRAGGVKVEGNYAYISAWTHGLHVVDVSDLTAPNYIRAVGYGIGIRDLDIVSGFVYLVDHYEGLWIFDLTDPSFPVAIGNPTHLFNPPEAIVVDGDMAYALVDGNYDYKAIHVLDVSNPASPSFVGQISGWDFSDLTISNDLLFVGSFEGVKVIDISEPSNPTSIGSASTPGYVRRLVVQDDLVFLADDHEGLRIVDVVDPTSPVLMGLASGGGYVKNVAVHNGTAYLASGYAGLRVVDVSDPSQPIHVETENTNSFTNAVGLADDLVFVAGLYGELGIYGVNRDRTIDAKGVIQTGTHGLGVTGNSTKVFVACSAGGVYVVDIVDPSLPTIVGVMDGIGLVKDIDSRGDTVFAISDIGLFILDLSDPAHGVVLGRLENTNYLKSIDLVGDIAYVVGGSGLLVVDCTNLSDPLIIGSFPTDNEYFVDVSIAGNYAYILPWGGAGYGNQGMQIVDVSNPVAPVGVGYFFTGGDESAVFASPIPDGYSPLISNKAYYPLLVYLADGNNGLQIIQNLAPVSYVPNPGTGFSVLNYPNPFNPSTAIAFNLTEAAAVDLKICDVSGRLVRTALVGAHMNAGPSEWRWNGKDNMGRNVATGVYLYELQAGSQFAAGRMTLLR